MGVKSVPLSLTVNGNSVSVEVDPRALLVDLLRDELCLTGTQALVKVTALQRIYERQAKKR